VLESVRAHTAKSNLRAGFRRELQHAAHEFADAVFLVDGAPRYGVVYGTPGPADLQSGYSEHFSYAACAGFDSPYFFCVCPWCGRLGLEFEGRSARVCGWQRHHKTEDEARAAIGHGYVGRVDDKIYSYDDPNLLAAFAVARAARFEHGQTP
jgi:hypothetical protein